MKLVIAQANLVLRGGAERVVLKIAEHYKAKIYTAEYARDRTFSEFANLDVEEIGRSAFSKILPYGRVMQGLNYGMSFYNYKLKEDYDIINAHIAPSHWIRNKNDRVLWYCHTPLRDVYDLYEYRLSIRKAYQKPLYMVGAKAVRAIDKGVVKKIEGIVANSNNTKVRIEKYYKRDALVLNGGVEYEKFKNNGNDKYFLYVSRISPNKRQDYVIRAFELFGKKVKGYKLVIAGDISNDKFYVDYYNEIAELANKVGNVKFMIGRPDSEIIDLYSRATAVLFAAVDEDYGLIPLEAMASSKPIISVNEGGPKETVLDGKTGYLVNSVQEMAEKMQYIAEHPKHAEELGKNGRRRVIEKYSWKHFFFEYDKILRKFKKQVL
ncbi:MAG: glycosyltransferase family 4 protein [Candidatus Micrarchaeia archaeon]